MRCVGALLDNAQKLHAARRRDISIVHHNERPSDAIQYFTTLRHNRPAQVFRRLSIAGKRANGYRFRRDINCVFSYSEEINITSCRSVRCPFHRNSILIPRKVNAQSLSLIVDHTTTAKQHCTIRL